MNNQSKQLESQADPRHIEDNVGSELDSGQAQHVQHQPLREQQQLQQKSHLQSNPPSTVQTPQARRQRTSRQAPQGESGGQYVRVNPGVIKVVSVNPVPTPVPVNHQVITHFPPHYPPRITHTSPNHKNIELKSVENGRNITQQSFAPSQKTIVLNHISSQGNGVYHSHVSTERMGIQSVREPNSRHSQIHERMVSPARVNMDYGEGKEGLVVRNALFNSYIPTSNPIILERVGPVSSSNPPQPSERHFQQEETLFWKDKYEELSRRWQGARSKECKELEVANGKLSAIQKNYQVLQSSYDELVQEYHGKLQENQKYFEAIQQLQATLNQRHLPPKQDDRLLQKDLEIERLTLRLQECGKRCMELQGAYEEKCMELGVLREERGQEELRYEQEVQQMQEHATMLQMEVEQREAQLRERTLMRRSDLSQLDHSRMDSLDNTRTLELEMYIGKLTSEIKVREESFQRELKMANLNVAELVERMKSMAAEKDHTIRSLQEKMALLESDLNRKESLVRNLRDDLASKLVPAPPASVYSSAVNPVDHRVGQKEDAYKKELQNLRRSLFEREREKMILRQKYEQLQERVQQSEEALGKRKAESQAMRRQLNELDDLQHENEKLLEVISKKSAQIQEMKEMLLEKEQHAGDFENLSQENDRLRTFMLKKNEELSEMAQKLYHEEKRVRELETTHGPRLRELEEQVHRLNELLARKDIEIDKLNQSLSLLEGNYSEIEFELERNRNIGQEYDELIRINNEQLQRCHEDIEHLRQECHEKERMLNAMEERIEGLTLTLAEREIEERRAQQRLEELGGELRMREEHIKEMTLEHSELRQFKSKSTKQLQQFQSKQGDLQLRCRDLESLLRSREQRIARAQKELQQSREQVKKHQSCGKLIEQMTERVSQYEMRIISLTMNRGYSKINEYPQPAQVFENQVIYRLKKENEQLREEIGHLNAQLSQQQQQPRPTSGIKHRLKQFDNNLADTIQGSSGLKRVRSVQALLPSDPVVVQNREIERLKELAQEMQREEFLFGKRKLTPQYIDQVYQEEIAFLRNSNKELEERVQNLLQINKDLKTALQDSLANQHQSLKEYYEGEVQRVTRELAQMKAERGKGRGREVHNFQDD